MNHKNAGKHQGQTGNPRLRRRGSPLSRETINRRFQERREQSVGGGTAGNAPPLAGRPAASSGRRDRQQRSVGGRTAIIGSAGGEAARSFGGRRDSQQHSVSGCGGRQHLVSDEITQLAGSVGSARLEVNSSVFEKYAARGTSMKGAV